MGLPKININFFGFLKEKSKRVAEGTVVLLLKDDMQVESIVEYTQSSKITGWNENNIDYIKKTLLGEPRKVIAVKVAADAENYEDALKLISNMRFNYLAAPGPGVEDATEIAEWIIEQREVRKKSFKAVLPNAPQDHQGIVNYTTDEHKVGERVYSTSEYTSRVAGALAGLPFERSATYLVFPEVESIKEIEDADAAVNRGELILIDDGEKIKIGRGVNSLQTISAEKGNNEEFKSIRVVEILDMIHDEIHENFENQYIGKVPNIYDNQVLFIADVNRGFSEMGDLSLLDPNAENFVEVDVDAQRQAWENSGVDTSGWDDQEVKEKSFRRHVFLRGKIRVIDTIEDLDLNIQV